MTIRREQHWTDTPNGTGLIKRVISNWSNWYDTRQNKFIRTNQIIVQKSAPYAWTGNYDFQRQILDGPCQIFLGDSSDPSNTALWGMRRSDDPSKWINFKLFSVNPVLPSFNLENNRTTWNNIQKNTDMILSPTRQGIKHWMRIKGTRPLSWRIIIRQPSGFGFTVHNSSWVSFTDNLGVEYMRTQPKYGTSGTMQRPTNEVEDIFPVRVEEGNLITVNNKTLRTLVFTPDANAVENILQARKIVWVDPTTIISGTTDIEDGHIIGGGSANSNFGGNISFQITNAPRHTLFRISLTSIPAGSITGFRFLWTELTTNTFTLEAFFIADANDWVEGTATGATQTGSFSFNSAKHGTQLWAGSAGLGTAGTDYDADASPPTMTSTGASGIQTFPLDTAWPPLWRDSIRAANGIKLVNISASGSVGWSTEGTVPPTFEIDAEESSGASYFFIGF